MVGDKIGKMSENKESNERERRLSDDGPALKRKKRTIVEWDAPLVKAALTEVQSSGKSAVGKLELFQKLTGIKTSRSSLFAHLDMRAEHNKGEAQDTSNEELRFCNLNTSKGKECIGVFEGDNAIRTYIYYHQSAGGELMYYRCAKCKNLKHKMADTKWKVATVIKDMSNKVVVRGSHLQGCDPVPKSEAEAMQLDRKSRFALQEETLLPRQSWSQEMASVGDKSRFKRGDGEHRQRRVVKANLLKNSANESWRKRKAKIKPQREENLLKQRRTKVENDGELDADGVNSASGRAAQSRDLQTTIGNQKRYYRLSIALPGSILNNAQSPELRTYLAGQIARTAAVFCVDEVVIFDETARMNNEQRESYYRGRWLGDKPILDSNVECNFHLARILEFLECPQYLRKTLFPLQSSLKYAGVLNPLDCTHHFRSTDLSMPYREGVVLDKPVKKGRGSFCDVGLDKEVQIDSEIRLPPRTRVTLKLAAPDTGGRIRGTVVSAKRVRDEAGLYWGYNVRIALSLTDALRGADYDVIIGTSERGQAIEQFQLPLTEQSRILVVFGGVQGLEAAADADEQVASDDPADLFEHYLNAVPGQGSRTIRTEEAIPITLSSLRLILDAPVLQ